MAAALCAYFLLRFCGAQFFGSLTMGVEYWALGAEDLLADFLVFIEGFVAECTPAVQAWL
jgi:hypothetical protein